MKNIDTILKFLVPKDTSFYPLFDETGEYIVGAADHLRSLIVAGDYEQRLISMENLKRVTAAGHKISSMTYHHLDQTFITPFDRSDIYTLSGNIDDVFKSVSHVARSIGFYQPAELKTVYNDLTENYCTIAVNLRTCLKYLREPAINKKAYLNSLSVQALLENRAEEIIMTGVSSILDEEKNLTELIKHKAIIENFEKCIFKANGLTETLTAIIMKVL